MFSGIFCPSQCAVSTVLARCSSGPSIENYLVAVYEVVSKEYRLTYHNDRGKYTGES